jgi:ketosteroid isomerase-like protein
MSEKNKAILTEANAAVVRGDHEGFLSHCTDDVEWTFVGDRTLKGKEAVRRYMRKAYVEPPRFTVAHLIAEGDFVTAVGDIDSRDDAGKVVRSAYCDVWRIRNGKLAELKAFVIETEPDGRNG